MHPSRALVGLSCVLVSTLLLSCGGSDGTGVDDRNTVATVTVSPPSSTIEIGQTTQLTATARNGDGEILSATVSWSSNPSGVASVGVATGLVTGVSEGGATITATAGGKSGTATVTVTDPFPPGAPSDVQATAVSDTRIDVTWADNSDNEDSFVIEREALGPVAAPGAPAGAAAFVEAGSVGENETTFQDTGVDPASTYQYRVLACNGNGCSDASDNSPEIASFLTLEIGTTELPDGVTAIHYEKALVATGGDGVVVWAVSAGDLPPGITLASSTGLLSGDPTTAGTFDFTVEAAGAGQMVTREFSITIRDVPLPPVVATAELPDAGVGAAFSTVLEAEQGDGTYAWAVSAGALPDGLELAAGTGEISGVPTTEGTSDFTVEVTSAEMMGDADLSITVLAALEVATSQLPSGVEGQPYEASLASSGGDGSGTWSLESGSLPEGLGLASDGTISGTVSAAAPPAPSPGLLPVVGMSDFTVRVENDLGQVATRDLSITVNAVLEITTSALADGQVDAAYSEKVLAVGGDGNNTWSIAGGDPPPGLNIVANTGEIAGSPGASGMFDFTVQVESGDGQTAQKALSITIMPGPVSITTTSLPDGEVGTPYSQEVMVTGGTGTFTWALTTGDLPDGLMLDPNTGIVSGKPTTTGTFNFTVEASSGGMMDDQALSITIVPGPLSLDTDVLVGAFPGAAYSDFFEASGGDGTYTFAVTGGALPDGLMLDPATGELSGTAGMSGAYYFTIQVSSDVQNVSKTYALAISTKSADAFNVAIMNVAGNTIPSAAVIAGLSTALARWEAVIVGNLGAQTYGTPPDVIPPGFCSGDGPKLNGFTVDDVMVLVNLANIDGPGNTLGSAGPCDVRVYIAPSVNFAATFGRLTLDTSDLAGLDAHQMSSLLFHEIGHIMGFGTLWDLYSVIGPLVNQPGAMDLISDAVADGGTEPKYEGTNGNAVYTGPLGGGSSGMATKIPLEDEGGPGTYDAHWEEGEFDTEIMTGFAEASGIMMEVSALTLGALADFRYTVDTSAADAFTIPGCAPTCAQAPPPPPGLGAPSIGDRLVDDILDEPIRGVLPDGTTILIPRPSER